MLSAIRPDRVALRSHAWLAELELELMATGMAEPQARDAAVRVLRRICERAGSAPDLMRLEAAGRPPAPREVERLMEEPLRRRRRADGGGGPNQPSPTRPGAARVAGTS